MSHSKKRSSDPVKTGLSGLALETILNGITCVAQAALHSSVTQQPYTTLWLPPRRHVHTPMLVSLSTGQKLVQAQLILLLW